jgi:hypothetical protein
MRSYVLYLALWTMITTGLVINPHASNASNERNELPQMLQQIVEGLQSDIESRGFEVSQGAWNLFKIEDCRYAIERLGFCLGNNPAAPYIIPTLPLWPDELVDEDMRELLGPTANDTWWTFRLDEREALVVLAHLPPPGAYFGIQTYIFSRQDAIDTTDPIYRNVTDPFMHRMLVMTSPDPSRLAVFASVGDSNNNVVIEAQSGAAFDQQRFFIITPDAVMERELTEALLRAGVTDSSHIFIEDVSAELARLGLGADADDFMILMRYAFPEDEDAGERWREQLPLTVLRVRDTDLVRGPERYPIPGRDERTVNRSEMELEGDLTTLITEVKQHWGQADATEEEFESLLLRVDLTGEHCLRRPMNCLGDTSDADYQVSPTVSIDSGEVLAVVGTLGTATGNATYASLSVNWLPPLVGVANISDKDLAGTASAFSVRVGNTDKLYLHYFARDCTHLDPCFEITVEMIPPGDAVKIIQRNYVVPGTARGPDPNQLVNPAFIVLHGEIRPEPR